MKFPSPTSGGNAKQRRAARRRWQHFLRVRYGLAPGWHPLTRAEEAQAFEIAAALACLQGNLEDALTPYVGAPATDQNLAMIEHTIARTLRPVVIEVPLPQHIVITGTITV
jgi:hypothetical protein